MEKQRKINEIFSDVVVIGGGLGGMCAAISAARGGAKTVLIHERPVLGGNQSSESQVGICGADCSGGAVARYVRETGILEEIWLEHMHRTPEYGTGWHMQDITFWEAVTREENMTLLLNTRALHAITKGDGSIEAVEAVQISTENEYLIHGKIFIDCSGDSGIAADAGAEFRVGREASSEFGESMAPEAADSGTMGSSIFFTARNMGYKVPFVRPEWAYEFPSDEDLPYRGTELEDLGSSGQATGFWWLEHGGLLDTIGDNERIRDELYKIVFGIWDHMKNKGDHGVDNWSIIWMNTMPAKRESRRLMGDYIVNQNDVQNRTPFDDRVAYAGWSIDIHPPAGIFSKEPPCTGVRLSDVWSIPFRSLYSKNVPNLMMAGRNISTTHVAMGSSRVMATCSLEGQAVGNAAVLCLKYGETPRQLCRNHMKDLQQELLKQGCYIIDVKNEDIADLARQATVTASSQAALQLPQKGDKAEALDQPIAHLIPVSGGKLDRVEFLLQAEKENEVTVRVWTAPRINTQPGAGELLATAKATVLPGEPNWVSFETGVDQKQDCFLWVELMEAPEVSRWHSEKSSIPATRLAGPAGNLWGHRKGFSAMKISPVSYPYSGENILSGVTRPEKWTNMWMSEELNGQPQYLELDLGEETQFNTVYLTFDTDVNTNIYLPEPWGVFGVGSMPTCVKDYDIQALVDGSWVTVSSQRDNYHGHKVHHFDTVSAQKLRLAVLSTNGDPAARVFEIRCYQE